MKHTQQKRVQKLPEGQSRAPVFENQKQRPIHVKMLKVTFQFRGEKNFYF